MRKKSALITGVAGMDGSYLAEFLLEKDYQVYGIIRRNATRNLENVGHLENDIDIIEGDITDMSSMMRIIQSCRPHELYNLAAMSHVHTSFEQPLATLNIDTCGLVNILETVKCLGYSTRIFHASTSEMFGSSPAPQTMDTPLIPQSPYAIAKLASHHFMRLYRQSYKMHCSSGITFNHECFFYDTPVIIKKNNEIDIVYVNSLVSHRKNINQDSSQLTKEYEGLGLDIWDGEQFVELKAVSRKKLNRLDKENRKRQITNAPAGLVSTTPNHNLINNEKEKKPASRFSKDDCVLLGAFPEVDSSKVLSPLFAKFLGLLCGDGYVSDNLIRLINNDENIQKEFIDLSRSLFCRISHKISPFVSGFGGTTTHLDISGLGEHQCICIREMLYDSKTKHKRVPTIILNASTDIKKCFLQGYNLADGLKKGNETYEFASFKTNSPLLAQGLLFLLKCVTGQTFNINGFVQRDKVYYQINLHSPKNPHKYWGHLKVVSNSIKKIVNIFEDNQHVFDIETASGKVMAGIGTMVVGNSERRGPLFVTRKITMNVAQCLKDPSHKVYLGNVHAKRDWGYAPDYVRGFYLTLQQENPDDYIFATGETHSVKEFCEKAFGYVGLNWEDHVEFDRFLMRPSEVDELQGDYSRTKEILGWEPEVKFDRLVEMMVDHDCELLGVKK